MIRIMTVVLFITVLATIPASAHDDDDPQTHCIVTSMPVVLEGSGFPIQRPLFQTCDTLRKDIGGVVGNR